jgi:hypothetical protein
MCGFGLTTSLQLTGKGSKVVGSTWALSAPVCRKGDPMKFLPLLTALGASTALLGAVAAQTAVGPSPEEKACAPTRAEVRADCIQYMKTHRWADGASNWVLKSGARPPEGVKTREQVKAERDKFLAVNRWNDAKTMWEPIGKARDLSQEPLECAQTRAEVRADCQAFLKTHRFDEGSSTYIKK